MLNSNVFARIQREVILDAGADVNARNETGLTALMAAAKNSNPLTVEALLNAGADITLINEDGKTAWDFAQDNRRLKGTDAYLMLNEARFK